MSTENNLLGNDESAVNKKAFSNGSKSVEDEKKCFLNHFNLSKKSGDDISI